jgi:anti-anti-sigma factor
MTFARTDSPLVVSRSRRDNPVLVVSLAGRLDGTTTSTFRRRVAEALRGRGSARVLVLDLTDVRALSPSGLSAVHRVCRQARAGGLRVLVVSSGPVRGVIDLVCERSAGVPYEVVDTRREAIALAGYPRRSRHAAGYGPVPAPALTG